MSKRDDGSADAQGPTPDTFLPCPFCGEAANMERDDEHDGLFVRCEVCGASLGPVYEDSPCADEAPTPRAMLLKAWNRRARGVRLGAPEQEPGATSGAPLHQAGWESAWVAWGKRQGAIRDGVTLDEILHAYLGAARGGTLREAAQAYFQVMDEAEAITEGRLPPRMGCAEEYQAAEAALRAALSGRTPGDAP